MCHTELALTDILMNQKISVDSLMHNSGQLVNNSSCLVNKTEQT